MGHNIHNIYISISLCPPNPSPYVHPIYQPVKGVKFIFVGWKKGARVNNRKTRSNLLASDHNFEELFWTYYFIKNAEIKKKRKTKIPINTHWK